MFDLYEIKKVKQDALIVYYEELKKEFKTLDELFAYLKENKDFYINGHYNIKKVG